MRAGLIGGGDARWEIDAVPDLPPTVAIEQPTSNLFVTPRAVVPLRITASDDLALRLGRAGIHAAPTGRSNRPPNCRTRSTRGQADRRAGASAGLSDDAKPPQPVTILLSLGPGRAAIAARQPGRLLRRGRPTTTARPPRASRGG